MLKVDVGNFLSLSFMVYTIFNILRTPTLPSHYVAQIIAPSDLSIPIFQQVGDCVNEWRR